MGCAAIRFLRSDPRQLVHIRLLPGGDRSEHVFFPVIACGTVRRLLPSDPFVGLYCEHLPASTVIRDFEQCTMSTNANGASDALGMGPFAGYNPISMITVLYAFTVFIYMSCLHAVAFVNDVHMHIYVITNLLMLYFWIKLTIKIPKFLTNMIT